MVCVKVCFEFYFVRILTNNVLWDLNLWMHVSNMHVQGTASQIIVLCLFSHLYFIPKIGQLHVYFSEYLFLDFIENKPGQINSNIFNRYIKFQVWAMHNERYIKVQNIKVNTLFYRYILHSAQQLIIYFHILYTISKVSHYV